MSDTAKNDIALVHVSNVFKAMSHPDRLKILLLLQVKKMSVHDIQEALHISQPHTSQHLKQLKTQGLLVEERKGRNIFYKLASPQIALIVADALQLELTQFASNTELIAAINEMISMLTIT